MERTILIGDDPKLRQKSTAVSDAELKLNTTQQIIDDLLFTMDRKDGLGLAAPQIDIHLQIIVVTIDREKTCLINPKIITHSPKKELGEEGCLSFPGLYGDVARYTWIEFEALDRNGKKMHKKVTNMDARVVQHEIDHLNGILLPDRLVKKLKN